MLQPALQDVLDPGQSLAGRSERVQAQALGHACMSQIRFGQLDVPDSADHSVVNSSPSRRRIVGANCVGASGGDEARVIHNGDVLARAGPFPFRN